MTTDDEVTELLQVLDGDGFVPAVAMELPDRFPAAVRDAAVRQVATRFAPPPSGRLLGRLPLIATDESRPVIVQIFLANLHSPDRFARQASLNGLAELRYEHVVDAARGSLHDVYDPVVAAAVRILAEPAAADPQLRALLAGVHEAHQGDPDFYLTTSMLAAYGIEPGAPS